MSTSAGEARGSAPAAPDSAAPPPVGLAPGTRGAGSGSCPAFGTAATASRAAVVPEGHRINPEMLATVDGGSGFGECPCGAAGETRSGVGTSTCSASERGFQQ